nr:hypothetical protein [Tanacetum cinerariifolium]
SYEIDYVLQSMPDDDLASLSGFEAEDSDDEGSQSNHQDNLSKESTVGTLNASDDMPAQSDPLGHLQKELRTLNTKFNQLESSISKKTIQDQLLSIVVKPINKQINAFNKLESCRFLTLQNELSKVKTIWGCQPKRRLMFKDMDLFLEAAEVFKKANVEGEKWVKNNPETPTEEKDA